MTAPTRNVIVTLHGAPDGTRVTARLDQVDVYQGFIVPKEYRALTVDSVAVMALFPNHPSTGLGTTGSVYTFDASPRGMAHWRVENVQVPDADCSLDAISQNAVAPALDAAQAAMAAASASAGAAGASAFQAASAATAAQESKEDSEAAATLATQAASQIPEFEGLTLSLGGGVTELQVLVAQMLLNWQSGSLAGYQPYLVSGTSIKTVNGVSLLGAGNVTVGGLEAVTVPAGLGVAFTATTLTLSYASGYSIPTTAAQSQWSTAFGWGNHQLAGYQSALVSGTSIKTINGSSVLGAGDIAVQAPLVSGTSIKTINGASLLGAGDIAIAGGGGAPSVVSVSPAANQNDYAPAGWSTATTLRLSPSVSMVITGLAAAAAGTVRRLSNATTDKLIVLAEENASSTAANRFKNAGGISRGHVIILPGETVSVEYDGTDSRWKLVATDRSPMRRWQERHAIPAPNGGGFSMSGVSLEAMGTLLNRDIDTASSLSSVPRHSFVTGTGANAQAGLRPNGGQLATFWGGLFRGRFGGAVNPGAAGVWYFGTSDGVSSPPLTAGNITANGGIANCFGVSMDPGETNLRWCNNGVFGVPTRVDLGAGFPMSSTAIYELVIFVPPGGASRAGVIYRVDDMSVTPGAYYANTNLTPSPSQSAFHYCVCNQASGAEYGVDVFGLEIYSPA